VAHSSYILEWILAFEQLSTEIVFSSLSNLCINVLSIKEISVLTVFLFFCSNGADNPTSMYLPLDQTLLSNYVQLTTTVQASYEIMLS